MNRDETIEAIRVMQAWVDGKAIVYRTTGPWFELNVTDPQWDWVNCTYDTKPEPRIVFALLDAQGNLGPGLYSEANATSAVRAGNHWVAIRKFIEVIE